MENMEKEGVIIFSGSAGSIEVIMNIFPSIPANYPFPVVLLLHRKNTIEQHLEDVLGRKSKVPVIEIQDKTYLKPSHIYVAPGDYHLLVDKEGLLCLDHSEKINYSRPSIDVTFDSFARIFKNHCVGILLSGANADGAKGLKTIKDNGGLSIVQSPESASVITMPMSAINLFEPDMIADPQKITEVILDVANYSIPKFIHKIKHGEDIKDETQSILLVDDLADNLFSLNAILKSEGYRIDKANSGKLAIEMASKHAYDCIVLDVQMPEMDGFEVAKILGEDELTRNIPIIFLSALGSDKEKVIQGIESGAIDFMAKPVDPPLMKAKIKLCLNISAKNKARKKTLSAIKQEHQTLKEFTTDVSASMRYAQNIQQAILPKAEIIGTLFKENLLIYRPKESIGGDFYYIKEINNQYIFIVGDCTGHGVPGAMMSMISVNMIHNIIETKGILQPHLILKAMVKEFRTAFRNDTSNTALQDGLELAICNYNKKEKKLAYAGAGRPIFVGQENKIHKIKCTPSGVSGTVSDNFEFELNELNVTDNMQVYLYSDGIVDQFGGPSNKKFMSKRLEQLIQSCQHLTMKQQQQIIDDAILNWKGKEEQIDDITVFGVKICN